MPGTNGSHPQQSSLVPANTFVRLAGIQKESFVDGPGIRTVIFLQGCTLGCKGCHNPNTHDPAAGEETDIQKLLDEVLTQKHADGITISGGEPFLQPEAVAALCKSLKDHGKHVMVFSGFTFENLRGMAATRPAIGEILSMCDILIDGPFIIAQRDLALAYRGSNNQRIIDLQETARTESLVILDWDGDPIQSFYDQQKHNR